MASWLLAGEEEESERSFTEDSGTHRLAAADLATASSGTDGKVLLGSCFFVSVVLRVRVRKLCPVSRYGLHWDIVWSATSSITRTTASEAMAMMHDPPHPGEILRSDYLEPLGLSVTAAASALGVTRKTLSAVLNERAGISPAMAYRLSKAFDTSPELWSNLQMQYDLWQARETDLGDVLRLVPA